MNLQGNAAAARDADKARPAVHGKLAAASLLKLTLAARVSRPRVPARAQLLCAWGMSS